MIVKAKPTTEELTKYIHAAHRDISPNAFLRMQQRIEREYTPMDWAITRIKFGNKIPLDADCVCVVCASALKFHNYWVPGCACRDALSI